MSTSSKGRAFEHEVRNLFRSAGFSVIRGAGSKGELFGEKVDLVATKRTRDTAYTAFSVLHRSAVQDEEPSSEKLRT